MTTTELLRERLSEIRPIGSSRNLVEGGWLQGLDFADGVVRLQLRLADLPTHARKVLQSDIERAVGALDGVRRVEILDDPGHRPHAPAPERAPLPGVRKILAVSSAKGGVGKSTVAANLALSLARLGQRVGLMDADVYGPSLPILFGLSERPAMRDDKKLVPLEKFGLQLMSVGFFLDESAPVIWRGPMVMGLVRQFLRDVAWSDLDVLVIDLPPGTGDAQLTLAQQVPLAGAVVVTTPQEVATIDVERGVAMFRQVNTPVLGLVENMTTYRCESCGHEEEIFGHGGAEQVAARFGLPLLARIPLVPAVRAGGDSGQPISQESPEHPTSLAFLDLARKVEAALREEQPGQQTPTILD